MPTLGHDLSPWFSSSSLSQSKCDSIFDLASGCLHQATTPLSPPLDSSSLLPLPSLSTGACDALDLNNVSPGPRSADASALLGWSHDRNSSDTAEDSFFLDSVLASDPCEHQPSHCLSPPLLASPTSFLRSSPQSPNLSPTRCCATEQASFSVTQSPVDDSSSTCASDHEHISESPPSNPSAVSFSFSSLSFSFNRSSSHSSSSSFCGIPSFDLSLPDAVPSISACFSSHPASPTHISAELSSSKPLLLPDGSAAFLNRSHSALSSSSSCVIEPTSFTQPSFSSISSSISSSFSSSSLSHMSRHIDSPSRSTRSPALSTTSSISGPSPFSPAPSRSQSPSLDAFNSITPIPTSSSLPPASQYTTQYTTQHSALQPSSFPPLLPQPSVFPSSASSCHPPSLPPSQPSSLPSSLSHSFPPFLPPSLPPFQPSSLPSSLSHSLSSSELPPLSHRGTLALSTIPIPVTDHSHAHPFSSSSSPSLSSPSFASSFLPSSSSLFPSSSLSPSSASSPFSPSLITDQPHLGVCCPITHTIAHTPLIPSCLDTLPVADSHTPSLHVSQSTSSHTVADAWHTHPTVSNSIGSFSHPISTFSQSQHVPVPPTGCSQTWPLPTVESVSNNTSVTLIDDSAGQSPIVSSANELSGKQMNSTTTQDYKKSKQFLLRNQQRNRTARGNMHQLMKTLGEMTLTEDKATQAAKLKAAIKAFGDTDKQIRILEHALAMADMGDDKHVASSCSPSLSTSASSSSSSASSSSLSVSHSLIAECLLQFPALLIVRTVPGVIRQTNYQVEKELSLPSSEMIGRSIVDIVPRRLQPHLSQKLRTKKSVCQYLAAKYTRWRFRTMIARPNGEWAIIDCMNNVITPESGGETLLMMLAVPITDWRRESDIGDYDMQGFVNKYCPNRSGYSSHLPIGSMFAAMTGLSGEVGFCDCVKASFSGRKTPST